MVVVLAVGSRGYRPVSMTITCRRLPCPSRHQDSPVEIHNPARRVEVVDRVPRPVQVDGSRTVPDEGPLSRSSLSGTVYGRRYRAPVAP